jgi:hypothetical protein
MEYIVRLFDSSSAHTQTASGANYCPPKFIFIYFPKKNEKFKFIQIKKKHKN